MSSQPANHAFECGSTAVRIEPRDIRELLAEARAKRGAEQQDVRDYIAEAERIAAGESLLLPQRQHLMALLQYAASLDKQLCFARAALVEVRQSIADCRALL
jgi:hypothetical protein